MAFFGLTQMGYQNSLKEISLASQQDPIRSKTQLGFLALPPLKNPHPPQRSIIPIDQVSQYGKGPDDSHTEYMRLRTKQTRNPCSPHEIYIRPMTASQDIGWWTKDEPIQRNLPWAHVPRRIKYRSEMSRFIDQMKLTNREFSLY